jgi:hypothetical protein
MRRTLRLGLLAVALLALAGTAGATAPADGTLSIKRGSGKLGLAMRGAVIGRLKSGDLDVVIPLPRSCEELYVWGHEDEDPPEFDLSTGQPMFLCSFSGKGIRFRVVGNIGIEIRKGRGLFMTAVGRGCGWIDGTGGTDGVWSRDEGDYQSLPNVERVFELGRPLDDCE